MRLMSTHGRLPAHILCLSSVQSLHSRRIWRTVCGPSPHWHWSVSALLMAWRYARRLILPVRICVITELIALCVPLCVVSDPFLGRTLSLKSSLPCLAFSQDTSYSSLIVCRMVDFVVAVKVRSDSGSGCGSGFVCAFRLWPAASLAARSATSLPGTPTCAGIHQSWTSQPWS